MMKAYIEIPLPFVLPIEEGNKIVSNYNDKSFKIDFEHNILYVTENKVDFEEINHTQLNITYVYDGEGVPSETNDLLRGIIYNCLGYVNDFLSSLRFTHGLNYIKNISIYELPDQLPVEVDGQTYLYITSPMKLIEEREILNSNDLAKVQSNRATWEKYPEIGLVDRFHSNAKHSLASENFISAIIDLQTSFEIFIRNTIRLAITLDGNKQKKSKLEIEKEIENKKNIYFRNLIEHHLSKKLDEDLDFNKHIVVKEWYEKLYKLRNNIVHSGKYHVNNHEAQEAYDSYVKLRNYISNRLVEKNYLSKEGYVNLKIFEEIYSNPLKDEEIREKLMKYNLLPRGVDFSTTE
ncbi:HEPN domain-containing protein [Peribacillus aracenensis]|uniref:HEPN domain-containing protein n=1 Tax=Peribacillus aracenensis TaxID=2976708 RepID=UPI0021A7A56E|nr:HEPN domain-containing protein [Peribacillus sp. BBB004]